MLALSPEYTKTDENSWFQKTWELYSPDPHMDELWIEMKKTYLNIMYKHAIKIWAMWSYAIE